MRGWVATVAALIATAGCMQGRHEGPTTDHQPPHQAMPQGAPAGRGVRSNDVQTTALPPTEPATVGAGVQVTEEYDRLRNYTAVGTGIMELGTRTGTDSSLNVVVSALYQGHVPQPPAVVSMMFRSSTTRTGGPRYRNRSMRSLELVLDGQPFPMDDPLDHEIEDGTEFLRAMIDWPTFNRIIAAATIEGRAAGTELVFTAAQIQTMRELASRFVPPAPAPSTPATEPPR